MSVSIKTTSHGTVGNCGFLGPVTENVRVGIYDIPLDEFCRFAADILNGGLLGWKGRVPECVQEAVQAVRDISPSDPSQ